MAAGRGIIEQQNLEQMIRNMYFSRDGKSGYATYYSFDMGVTFPEFSNRNENVLVDCSEEVLAQRIQAIEEDELRTTSEIVRLEEDVVGEALVSVGHKRELLETLEEELIAYRARCNRFRVRIEDRNAIVEARKAIEARNAIEAEIAAQNEPIDLSRDMRQEILCERTGQLLRSPIVRLQRFDQQRPEIILRRCDAPVQQPIPEPPVIMAEQQPLEVIEEIPEVEAEFQQEEIMDVEESIHSSESTDDENGDEIDEVEEAIYDEAIAQFENAANAGPQNVHDWAEEVLANEIAENIQHAQPEPVNVPQQPIMEPVIQMNPLPPPVAWNNTRFGLDAVQVLREYGRDVIIRVRLHEDRTEKAMIHLSTDVRENVYGERAIMQWTGVYTHAVGARTNPIPDIRCRLDGAPFVYTGLRRQYALRLFPYVDMEDDFIIATGWLVPPLGHTPDFSLERVVLGEDFLRENLHSINPGLMEVTLRADNGNLVRKRYQLRHRMRV